MKVMMQSILCAIFLIVVSVVDCSKISRSQSSVAQSFIDSEIVSDISIAPPQSSIAIEFPSGVEVQLGNELTPTEVKDRPTLSWDANSDTYYTLTMIDLDAPSRANPENRAIGHWLVGNIPGSDVANSETLWEFISSGPGLDSGLHRYVFLVYEQPTFLNFDEPKLEDRPFDSIRRNFSILEFAQKYGLGDPVAGNFYEAQFDDYVPILHEQLGIASK